MKINNKSMRIFAIFASVIVLTMVAIIAVPIQAEATTSGRTFTGVVSFVQDGDTIWLRQPLNAPSPVGDTVIIRLVGIDAPETSTVTGHPPGNQLVHGRASRDFLRNLLPRGTRITVVTDRVEVDEMDRVLGYVYKDTLNVNRELLRQGHAVTHVIWPNTYSHFSDFHSDVLEAMTEGRGMWNPADPIQELPFEYRLRVFNRRFERFVGDYFTKTYVPPADYKKVPVENRVQFWTEQDALNAGYFPHP